MQEQVNEKTVALYIKTGKLTAEMLQRAMKKLLSQMKKQADRPPHGKQLIVAEIDRQIDDHIGRQADLGHQLGHSRAEAFRKPALTGQIKTGSYHNNDSQNPLQCM